MKGKGVPEFPCCGVSRFLNFTLIVHLDSKVIQTRRLNGSNSMRLWVTSRTLSAKALLKFGVDHFSYFTKTPTWASSTNTAYPVAYSKAPTQKPTRGHLTNTPLAVQPVGVVSSTATSPVQDAEPLNPRTEPCAIPTTNPLPFRGVGNNPANPIGWLSHGKSARQAVVTTVLRPGK